MNYEDLLIEAEKNGLIVKEKPLVHYDGRIKGNRIAIRKDINTETEKACVLAEELGHHHTTCGNILDMKNPGSRKQERQARLWAYDKQIGLIGLVKAFEHGCRTRHEIAEFLDVAEEFLENAIQCYTSKYGIFTTVDCYVIYFIPTLTIAKVSF